LTPERWAQIEELFHRAAECVAENRAALLERDCAGDPELRREIETLLGSEERAVDRMQAAVVGVFDLVDFPLIGQTISHYRILAALGGGGMGLVYRAEDIKLGRQVALKFLPEELREDPDALGRFEREARSASALEHPNICTVYEFGEHEGQPFIVMQLLQGHTLRELISAASPGKALLPLDMLLDLAIQIASGLEAAHGHGIVHRDVKPANIFVTQQGHAKILDFGLAKHSREEVAEEYSSDRRDNASAHERTAASVRPATTPDPLLSRAGRAMGTAGYMSPEQARGEKLDARTDLFSFGLVLYEMATGQCAFSGDCGPTLRDAILRQTPISIRKFNPKLPGKLEAIIHRALEKNRNNRYQSAAEMRAALGLLRETPAAAKSPRWFLRTGSILGMLLFAGGASWFIRRHISPALPEVRFRPLTINSGDNPVRFGSISPDGQYLAYVDKQGMHIRNTGNGTTQGVAPPESFSPESVDWEIPDAAWLPDGDKFIANCHPASERQDAWTSATTSIWSFSRSGAAPKKFRDNAYAWTALRDGSISFSTDRERQSWLMGSEGEAARKVADADENAQLFGPFAQSSADLQMILLGKHDDSGDYVLARNLRGGAPITIFTPAEMKQIQGDFAWLPDGRLIYQAVDRIPGPLSVLDAAPGLAVSLGLPCNFWALLLDLHSGKPLGKPQRLTSWTGFCSSGINASADGKHVAFLRLSPGFGTSYIAQLEDGGTRISNSRHFTLEEADDAITGWTADSKAVILVSNRSDHYELYKQLLTSDTPQLLASVPNGANEQANLSPDGKWIIALTYPFSSPAELNQIVRVPIDGGSPQLILKSRELSASYSCARPPAERCVLSEISEDHKLMVVSDLDPLKGKGGELARFAFDPQFDPNVNSAIWDLSPGGTRFAINRGSAGPLQIYSFKDHSIRLIRPKATVDMLNLYWSADGKGFYFSNRTKDGMEVLHMDAQGNTKSLWKNSDRTFCVPSPDGRYLAIYDVKRSSNYWMMESL
jgi:serine/threonine protein kinase/Tol biopolymer transport system component